MGGVLQPGPDICNEKKQRRAHSELIDIAKVGIAVAVGLGVCWLHVQDWEVRVPVCVDDGSCEVSCVREIRVG